MIDSVFQTDEDKGWLLLNKIAFIKTKDQLIRFVGTFSGNVDENEMMSYELIWNCFCNDKHTYRIHRQEGENIIRKIQAKVTTSDVTILDKTQTKQKQGFRRISVKKFSTKVKCNFKPL